MRRAPILIIACAIVGCGPSFQALYEGDARFEHCYALEEDGVISLQKKADCWRDWTDHYTFGQTRDRVQYASMRYRALTSSSLPTDEGMMSAAPGAGNDENPGGTALAPTNAFAPPPTTASASPGSAPRATWMTEPANSANGGSGSGGSWMQTAPTNVLPDQSDAGTQLVAPAQGQQPSTGPVPSASQNKPTSPAPKKKK
jgi:hypothetical protein